MARVIKNPIEDKNVNDSIPLQLIIQKKKVFIVAKNFYGFLLQFKNITLELLNAMRKVKNKIYLELNFI